ncbi:endonuclease NucS domain-containing protein [Halanaerobium sp. MA284_MarDTE_T2]|uniref:endonuclease NucS domain-containing protein n=1 Tax=Halanaerobium sp. MA284_MarDTE_T2 TaxID=2183913 RepID=UPI000E14E976|nr:endonuclease NucS domain-containing protein [Halanaerobium sp. MA284_MarDTE_T2]RCW48189.1 uncharacterized protein DUF91 [Halanaerobium sp. MA284_MarDTE_T2]
MEKQALRQFLRKQSRAQIPVTLCDIGPNIKFLEVTYIATKITSWEIINGKLEEINTNLADEGRTESYDLEEWILSNSEILGEGIAIIGRQINTRSGPLDLLGIDKNGNTVIIEIKRDKLPREALAQAIDYAAAVAEWDIDQLSEEIGKNLEDFLSDTFEEITLENLNINQTQRILLVGFKIEDSLNRMIEWLSDNFSVSINAVILHYVKTQSGAELLSKTTTIPEEVEKQRTKKKFTIPMSDEPGNYDKDELKELLINYFKKDLKTPRRIKNVLLPECLKKGTVTREELKQAFLDYNEPNAEKNKGYFVSLISNQIGMEKNDFLRQIISYDYPNHSWEKDNYKIRDEYIDFVKELIDNN